MKNYHKIKIYNFQLSNKSAIMVKKGKHNAGFQDRNIP